MAWRPTRNSHLHAYLGIEGVKNTFDMQFIWSQSNARIQLFLRDGAKTSRPLGRERHRGKAYGTAVPKPRTAFLPAR
jgi:hypothetical protein